ncbi:hypothetical protein CSOJ01_12839 [Colletotrichum sojae]|uniref:Uncharacterized protein n=1 Tax=Colletotrichum sojae TaxID=2175907 RepID=A0A8H6IUJ3_9PEZI|nr:hypothetical protein CSOJ01_12839 [Colletotrichum sojae]
MAADAEIEAVQAHIPHIPYEIFLLVVKAAVEDAYSKARTSPCNFWLCITSSPSVKLFVDTDDEDGCDTFRPRFSLVQNISQIDRSARAAVHRRFVRFPWGSSWPSETRPAIPEGWVLPSVDAYDITPYLLLEPLRDPNPECRELLQHIRILIFNSEGNLRDFGERTLALLGFLPSVEVITTVDYNRYSRRSGNRCRGRPGDIINPDKLMIMEINVEMLCRPFWELGIRVHFRNGALDRINHGDDVEAISTPEGMRLKLLAPEVDCYNEECYEGPASDSEDDE